MGIDCKMWCHENYFGVEIAFAVMGVAKFTETSFLLSTCFSVMRTYLI